MFYSSPRNHPEIQVALLEKLQCKILFTPEQMSDATRVVLENRQMDKYILPDLDYFFAQEPVEPYPYSKTFEQACKDPYVALHSSGSTGTPKIVVLKQGSAAAHDAFQLFPSLGAAPWLVSTLTGKRVLTSFPWVHAGGACLLSSAIYNDFTPVIPAEWPLQSANANYLHAQGNVQAAWYSPAFLIDIVHNSSWLENISKLSNVFYSGGILSTEIGDAISRHTRLCGSMASTEAGILPGEMPAPEMWNYSRYNERLGHAFRHYTGDMYELVYTRDKTKELFQSVFYTLPDTETYETRDLFVQHPTCAGWWRPAGRIDDLVIMSDAKKLNPLPYEAVIEKQPGIATALICGTGRSRPAVLVQPSQWPVSKQENHEKGKGNDEQEKQEEEEEQRNFIEAAWTGIDRANEAGPAYGRLIKELVVVTKKYKPMIKAGGKDTVQRKASLQLYHDEINEAYLRAESLGLLSGKFELGRTGEKELDH